MENYISNNKHLVYAAEITSSINFSTDMGCRNSPSLPRPLPSWRLPQYSMLNWQNEGVLHRMGPTPGGFLRQHTSRAWNQANILHVRGRFYPVTPTGPVPFPTGWPPAYAIRICTICHWIMAWLFTGSLLGKSLVNWVPSPGGPFSGSILYFKTAMPTRRIFTPGALPPSLVKQSGRFPGPNRGGTWRWWPAGPRGDRRA